MVYDSSMDDTEITPEMIHAGVSFDNLVKWQGTAWQDLERSMMQKNPNITAAVTYTLTLVEIGIISDAAHKWDMKKSEALRRIVNEWNLRQPEIEQDQAELTPES
jgi:hypothetical protein